MDPSTTPARSIPEHSYDPRLVGVRATIRFDVAGDGAWSLRIDDGNVELTPEGGRSDLSIACSRQDFDAILSGAENLLTATLRGDIEVDGDLSLALRFHGIAAPPSPTAPPAEP